jgi:hypothetical protein
MATINKKHVFDTHTLSKYTGFRNLFFQRGIENSYFYSIISTEPTPYIPKNMMIFFLLFSLFCCYIIQRVATEKRWRRKIALDTFVKIMCGINVLVAGISFIIFFADFDWYIKVILFSFVILLFLKVDKNLTKNI